MNNSFKDRFDNDPEFRNSWLSNIKTRNESLTDFIDDDIKKPTALFISTKALKNDSFRKIEESDTKNIMEITNLLREIGIDAVPSFSEEAAKPSKTVVTRTGIQTPLLKPKDVKKSADEILTKLGLHNLFNNNSIQFGRVIPVTKEQMLECGGNYNDGDRVITSNKIDTNKKNKDKIKDKYGENFEYDLIEEASNSDNLISINEIEKQNENGIKRLYRGATFTNSPYVSIAAREGKNIAYSTPDIETAVMYSGTSDNSFYFSMFAEKEGNKKQFGFVYEYEADENTKLYQDYNIEIGGPEYKKSFKGEITPQIWKDAKLETPVFPHKNKLSKTYLSLKDEKGKDLLFPIPENDERWEAFKELYKTKDNTLQDHMIDRRKAILKSPKAHNLKPKSLGVFSKKIEPKSFEEDMDKYFNTAKKIETDQSALNDKKTNHSNRKKSLHNFKAKIGLVKAPKTNQKQNIQAAINKKKSMGHSM